MYLINTSFHAEKQVAEEIIVHVKTVLKAIMSDSGIFTGITMAEILVEVDPECTSFTLQAFAEDLAQAMDWLQNHAQEFFGKLHHKYNGKVVYFTTPMKVI